MKIIFVKKHFKEAISLCERVAGRNLSLPVLSNILVLGKDKKVKLTSTNLEIGLSVEIPAKIEQEGEIAIPASIIGTFISNLPGDENITLELQNNNVSILTSNSSTLVKCQPSKDFPSLPSIKSGKSIEIPVSDFLLGLKSVWYAASSLDIKPEISSVYMLSEKDTQLSFVATDSFRLAERKIKCSAKDFGGVLVPIKTVSEILRVFDGREGKIKIIADKNQIFLTMDNIYFVSRLTEGVFPDYQQIIPGKFVSDVIVDKSALTDSLKVASIFSGKLNEIKIIIGSENKTITVNTSSGDLGEHTANIPAKITGDDLVSSFNYKYIFDCLQFIPSQEIIMRFSGEGKPLVITGTDDNSFQYLVMPMNNL